MVKCRCGQIHAYDAFGNCNVYYSSSDTDIASVNPIRYRGYYHDEDAGLYYLNARYYNPQWRRFISPANASSLNPDSVNGLNLYSYAHNHPINIAYSGASVGSNRMVSSIGYTLSNSISGGVSSNSEGNDLFGSLLSGVSSAHGFVDKISSYVAGSADGILSYLNNPQFNGFHGKLNSYSKWLIGIGIGLDVVSSAYKNYINTNLTTDQKLTSFGADIGYIAVTSGFSYIAGELITKGAVALGTLVGGVTGAIVVVVAIVAGTVLIAVISDALDNWWEEKKEEWFN